MTRQTDERPPRGAGSSSVRVAIVLFLGTLVLLFVMGAIWLFVRVEAPGSAWLRQEVPLSFVVSGQQLCLRERSIVVLDHDQRTLIG